MAKGDLTIFEEFALDVGTEKHQLDTDSHKLMLISTVAASIGASTATPVYGDFSGAEMASGNGYTTTGAVSATTYVEAGGVGTFDGADVTWSQNASGFTTARTAVLYNDTPSSAALKAAICYVDLGSANVSLQDGDVTVSWHSSGVLTVTVTP